jgi:hypothetical protein
MSLLGQGRRVPSTLQPAPDAMSSFRGIPPEHLPTVQQKYLEGGDVRWSAFNW